MVFTNGKQEKKGKSVCVLWFAGQRDRQHRKRKTD